MGNGLGNNLSFVVGGEVFAEFRFVDMSYLCSCFERLHGAGYVDSCFFALNGLGYYEHGLVFLSKGRVVSYYRVPYVYDNALGFEVLVADFYRPSDFRDFVNVVREGDICRMALGVRYFSGKGIPGYIRNILDSNNYVLHNRVSVVDGGLDVFKDRVYYYVSPSEWLRGCVGDVDLYVHSRDSYCYSGYRGIDNSGMEVRVYGLLESRVQGICGIIR